MFTEQKFSSAGLPGLSEKQISEHLKLYAGYVKQTNDLLATGQESIRRFAFEFNGMRLHELYFEALSSAPTQLTVDSGLSKAITTQFGGMESLISEIKKTATTRGSGWVLLVTDKRSGLMQTIWIQSHEIGHLAGCNILLALDLWEHAYLLDYLPSERAKYLDALLNIIDWKTVEKRYE